MGLPGRICHSRQHAPIRCVAGQQDRPDVPGGRAGATVALPRHLRRRRSPPRVATTTCPMHKQKPPPQSTSRKRAPAGAAGSVNSSQVRISPAG